MTFLARIKEKLENYRRVLTVARKPTKEEFQETAKITGMGILLIGVIGFVFLAVSLMFIG
jgi:protein transport protein SEC61 subunit gamma-like protein